jgi:hypothetical protein
MLVDWPELGLPVNLDRLADTLSQWLRELRRLMDRR